MSLPFALFSFTIISLFTWRDWFSIYMHIVFYRLKSTLNSLREDTYMFMKYVYGFAMIVFAMWDILILLGYMSVPVIIS